MPKIPTVALSSIPAAPALGPQASEGAFNAVNQGIVRLGAAIGDVADKINFIAQKRQEHINKGILAQEEVIFEKTQQEIMRQAEENRANPEKLPAMAEATWAQYSTARAKRAADQGYTREMADTLDNRYSVGIERFNTTFNGKVQGLQIQKANTQLLSSANYKASLGDLSGALGDVRSMNLFPDELAQTEQNFVANHYVNQANSKFNEVSQMSVADQIKEYGNVAEFIGGKNPNGSYIFTGIKDENGKPIGNLPENIRNTIVSRALAFKEQASNQEMLNLKPILKQFEDGGTQAGNEALLQAIQSGSVTQETANRLGFTFNAVAATGAQERAQKALPDMRRREAAYQSLVADIAKITPEQITRQVEADGITPEQGKRLMGILNTRALTEMDVSTVLMTEKGLRYTGEDPRKLLESYVRKNADINKEGSVDSKSELLQAINDAPMSVEAKRRMTSKALEVFTLDFRDSYKSTAPVEKGGFFSIFHRGTKRAISPREADVRSMVYRNMRVAGDLGKPFTIDYLIEAERDITDHFANKENGEIQHSDLEKRLKDRLAGLSGQAIIRENLFD